MTDLQRVGRFRILLPRPGFVWDRCANLAGHHVRRPYRTVRAGHSVLGRPIPRYHDHGRASAELSPARPSGCARGSSEFFVLSASDRANEPRGTARGSRLDSGAIAEAAIRSAPSGKLALVGRAACRGIHRPGRNSSGRVADYSFKCTCWALGRSMLHVLPTAQKLRRNEKALPILSGGPSVSSVVSVRLAEPNR